MRDSQCQSCWTPPYFPDSQIFFLFFFSHWDLVVAVFPAGLTAPGQNVVDAGAPWNILFRTVYNASNGPRFAQTTNFPPILFSGFYCMKRFFVKNKTVVYSHSAEQRGADDTITRARSSEDNFILFVGREFRSNVKSGKVLTVANSQTFFPFHGPNQTKIPDGGEDIWRDIIKNLRHFPGRIPSCATEASQNLIVPI